MQDAGVQPHQQVVGGRGAREQVGGDDGLPAPGVDLALEEGEEVGVVRAPAEVRGGVLVPGGLQLLDDVRAGGLRGPLVAGVVVVGLLELGGVRAGAEEGQDVVYDLVEELREVDTEWWDAVSTHVVVEAYVVEIDMMCLEVGTDLDVSLGDSTGNP